MSENIVKYKLFVSCPNDVVDALSYIDKAVDDFNKGFGDRNGIIILTEHWSKDAYADMRIGRTAQEIIIEQLVKKADMLVAVFGSRFGSPTKNYESGTEEEIELMLNAGKTVILYFIDCEVHLNDIDPEQLAKINKFKEKHKNDGLYVTLRDKTELVSRLRHNLEMRFANKPSDPNPESSKKCILWVDDHPESNSIGRDFFENFGIEVGTALSTSQAFTLLEHKPYSAIIYDMHWRENTKEGYVLLDKLREKGDRTPFVIFTGLVSHEHKKEMEKHGGDGYTDDFSELFMTVTSLMAGHRS